MTDTTTDDADGLDDRTLAVRALRAILRDPKSKTPERVRAAAELLRYDSEGKGGGARDTHDLDDGELLARARGEGVAPPERGSQAPPAGAVPSASSAHPFQGGVSSEKGGRGELSTGYPQVISETGRTGPTPLGNPLPGPLYARTAIIEPKQNRQPAEAEKAENGHKSVAAVSEIGHAPEPWE